MDAQNNGYVKSIYKRYDKNDENEFDEDKIRQVVVNGVVPTLIADAGASAHCGNPSTSTCRIYKLNADNFITTGKNPTKFA